MATKKIISEWKQESASTQGPLTHLFYRLELLSNPVVCRRILLQPQIIIIAIYNYTSSNYVFSHYIVLLYTFILLEAPLGRSLFLNWGTRTEKSCDLAE